MFNTYITRGPEHVHEHRAPTDASVKLLTEMEQAAKDKVLGTLLLENNHFTGSIVVSRNHFADTLEADCVFKLNGSTRQRTVTVRGDATPSQLLEKVHAEIAEEIAREFLDFQIAGHVFTALMMERR